MRPAQATTVVDDERMRITTWTEHDVANVSGGPAVFVEIDLNRGPTQAASA